MKKQLILIIFSAIAMMAASPKETGATSDDRQLVLVATVSVNALPVEVSTTCKKGAAIFIVKNVGDKFPAAIDFTIIDVSADKVFSKRRMNLAAGQSATFKLKNADKVAGEVGLFMDAQWFPRDRQIDAAIRCDAA